MARCAQLAFIGKAKRRGKSMSYSGEGEEKDWVTNGSPVVSCLPCRALDLLVFGLVGLVLVLVPVLGSCPGSLYTRAIEHGIS
jgi:hypothetical protein